MLQIFLLFLLTHSETILKPSTSLIQTQSKAWKYYTLDLANESSKNLNYNIRISIRLRSSPYPLALSVNPDTTPFFSPQDAFEIKAVYVDYDGWYGNKTSHALTFKSGLLNLRRKNYLGVYNPQEKQLSYSILVEFSERPICPLDCTQRGICKDDCTCSCDEPYLGSDCAIEGTELRKKGEIIRKSSSKHMAICVFRH